jgi:recombination protein RecT
VPRQEVPGSALLVIEQGKNPLDSVAKTIDTRIEQIAAMYSGDRAMAERMKVVTLHALAHPKLYDKLMQADIYTVIEAIRESASLGLMPIPATAEGYLVPRWNKDKSLYDFTFMPGYRGLVKLIYRSDRVARITSHVVYEHDEFEYELSEGYIRHVPKLVDRGQMIATWGKAVILTDGHTESEIEIFDEARMHQIMRASSSRDRQGGLIGPWLEWPDPMRRKSVLRSMAKTLPLAYVAEEAIRLENDQEERYQSLAPAATGGGRSARLAATARGRLPGHGEPSGGPEDPAGAPGPTPAPSGPPESTEKGPLSPEEEEAIWRSIEGAQEPPDEEDPAPTPVASRRQSPRSAR